MYNKNKKAGVRLNICAIIPSLDPDEKLLEVVAALKEKAFAHIIVVDDGSSDKHYFDIISDDCDVLHHAKNLGKGRAIKTALNYYLNNYSHECLGVVLADSDNQHDIEDIYACASEILNSGQLVLGTRNFSLEGIPLKSRLGNKITAFIFRSLCGLNISDTQTGLRALSNECVMLFLDTPGERFEYETNMLLDAKKHGIEIKQVPIKTIYLEKNKKSHFNPLLDSISIYKVLLKFLWASLFSTFIDFAVFAFLIFLLKDVQKSLQIFAATAIARAVSSFLNFLANKNLVFKSKNGLRVSAAKYYTLCIVQMLCSYGGVYALTLLLGFKPLILKIMVDFMLFLISFQIQREWVFKNGKKH